MQNYILNQNAIIWDELVSILDTDIYHTSRYNLLEEKRLQGKSEAFYFKDGNKILFIPYIERKIDNTDCFDVTSAYGYPQPIFSYNAIDDLIFCEYALDKFIQTLATP